MKEAIEINTPHSTVRGLPATGHARGGGVRIPQRFREWATSELVSEWQRPEGVQHGCNVPLLDPLG